MGSEHDQLNWTKEADIVVVGGGGAGMATALSAAERAPDSEILILQKLPELGGSTTMAMGSFTAACTTLQSEAGVEDSTDSHFDDFDKFLDRVAKKSGDYFFYEFDGDVHEKDNKDLRRLMVENAGETFEWLRELGCEYAGPYAEGLHSKPRTYQIKPDTSEYRRVLSDHLEERGVEVMYETEVYELVEEDGRIEGVLARSKDKTSAQLIRATEGVVLATGEFSPPSKADDPEEKEGLNLNEHNDGKGHRMAQEVGADLVNTDIKVHLLRLGDPLYTGPEFPRLVAEGAILVNSEGQRIINETAQYDQIYKEVLRQDDTSLYLVFDETIANTFSEWPNHISTWGKDGKIVAYIDEYDDLAVTSKGESLVEIANSVGFSPDTFTETVEGYNSGIYDDVTDTHIDKYGRTRKESIDDPPYYAIGPLRPYSGRPEGGLRIDSQMRVLDSGDPITGLFAAGVMAGGNLLFGHGHHLAWTFTSGRLAGRAVVS